MNAKIKQLRDLVVGLDRVDRNIDAPDAEAYQAAARKALALTKEEMGLLPIGDFAGPVNSLQALAENLFFGFNGCFADIDGSGRAPIAHVEATGFFERMNAISSGPGKEIAESLFARLQAAPRARQAPRRRRRSVGTRA